MTTATDDNKLSDIDFPTGLCPPPSHPKHHLLMELIREHVKEYHAAARKTEERLYEGRRMRSKMEIISLVVDLLVPVKHSKKGRRGHFKRRLADGTWTIDVTYENEPQKLRKRVSHEFNKYLKKHKKEMASEPDIFDLSTTTPQQQALLSSPPPPLKRAPIIHDEPKASFLQQPYLPVPDAVHPITPILQDGRAIRSKTRCLGSDGDLQLPLPAMEATIATAGPCEGWEFVDVCSVLSDDESFDLSNENLLTDHGNTKISRMKKNSAGSISIPSIVTCTDSSNQTSYHDDEDTVWQEQQPDTVDSILRDMRENVHDADLQQSCCRLLGDMARSNAAKNTSFIALKGPTTVLEAMRLHKVDATVQQMACYALGQWAWLHPSNQTAFVTAGCFDSILTAMTSHQHWGKVQSYACFALANVLREHSINQSASGSIACIETAISAMNLHPDDAEIQYYGCLALSNMVKNHHENQSILGGSGGVEVVIKAMKRHTYDVRVQSSCCNVLGCFVWKHPTNQSIVLGAAEGATVSLIISAMDCHIYDTNVQCNGCFALGCLAHNNPDNYVIFVAARVQEKAVAVLERHIGNARVVEASCHLLYSCCLTAAGLEEDGAALTTRPNRKRKSASRSLRHHAIIARAVQQHQATNRRIFDCGRVLLSHNI